MDTLEEGQRYYGSPHIQSQQETAHSNISDCVCLRAFEHLSLHHVTDSWKKYHQTLNQ